MIVHTSVMLDEVLRFLVPPRPDALMLDCTLGEGGHAEAFLGRYPRLRYAGIDADPRIQEKARARLSAFSSRSFFLSGYFDEVLADWGSASAGAGLAGGERPDLVLFDLGVSMHHFAESGRGFGHARDEELDMRLSPEAPRSAARLLAEETEAEIARIIYEYGEERYSRRIARAIVGARASGPVATSGRLAEIVFGAVPPEYRRGRIHPATRTFQALRIAVNDELGRAERGIASAARLLAPGGTLGVISFHSLEDRIAKNLLRRLSGRAVADSGSGADRPIPEARDAILELVTKKPVQPTRDEVARNPASRSAKLRVARSIADPATVPAAAESLVEADS